VPLAARVLVINCSVREPPPKFTLAVAFQSGAVSGMAAPADQSMAYRGCASGFCPSAATFHRPLSSRRDGGPVPALDLDKRARVSEMCR